MKLDVDEKGTVVLTEVFNEIKFITPDKEELYLTMRDGGFEILYNDGLHRLNKGKLLIWKV